MKEFKGRVIAGGNWVGEAAVSHQPVNVLATFRVSAVKHAKQIIASDANNPDLYGENVTDKALCLPYTIGSTTSGLTIQTISQMKINPSAFLFSEHIDPLSASDIVLANVWEDSNIICIDMLGEEFLNTIKNGDIIEIRKDGTVIIK